MVSRLAPGILLLPSSFCQVHTAPSTVELLTNYLGLIGSTSFAIMLMGKDIPLGCWEGVRMLSVQWCSPETRTCPPPLSFAVVLLLIIEAKPEPFGAAFG